MFMHIDETSIATRYPGRQHRHSPGLGYVPNTQQAIFSPRPARNTTPLIYAPSNNPTRLPAQTLTTRLLRQQAPPSTEGTTPTTVAARSAPKTVAAHPRANTTHPILPDTRIKSHGETLPRQPALLRLPLQPWQQSRDAPRRRENFHTE
jgi:hypothetical protein